jgi:ribulose-phosphate 3-epimerase
MAELQQQLDVVAAVPSISTVQIDVIDGFFADNLTLTPLDLVAGQFGQLQFDLHLITDEPLDFVFEAIAVKKMLPIRAVIGQVEHMSSQAAFLEEIRQQQWQPGLSLDLYTPIESIDEDSWPWLKVIQIMGIEAGFQGQAFHTQALTKVEQLKQLRQKYGWEYQIIVDGGVKADILPEIFKAGADAVAAGSVLWESPEPIDTLRQLVTETQTLQPKT